MHRVHHKNDKTSSPFQYILQAAMGQCSTLPADGKKDNGSTSNSHSQVTEATHTSNHKSPRGFRNSSNSSSKKVYRDREQRESSGYRKSTQPSDNNHERHYDDGDVVMGEAFVPDDDGRAAYSSSSSRNVNHLVNMAKQGNSKYEQYINEGGKPSSPSNHSHSSYRSRGSSGRSNKVHAGPSREEIIFPPPPAGAVRTRCYRLNLDASVVLSPTHDHLGPMPYEPPAHLLPQRYDSRSISFSLSNESVERNPTQVAVNTARIFRGITVDKNGMITSQNARATRGSKGKDKSKQAATSRQQEKINKAKDLVDEFVGVGGKVRLFCCVSES